MNTEKTEIDKIYIEQSHAYMTFKLESIEDRLRLLKELYNLILGSRQEIISAFELDFKKSEIEVNMSELFPVLQEIRLILKNLKKWSSPKKVKKDFLYLGSHCKYIHEPKGRMLIIAPWNYPFSLSLVPFVAAIAAGNSVILKPSEQTPHVSLLIKKIIEKVFLKSRAAVILGDKNISEYLLSKKFDHIFFTGSNSVGKIVYQQGANTLTPVTLELGGKSPVIIDPNFNLEKAVKKIIWAKNINSGQTCIAPDYVFVPKNKLNEFVKICQSINQKLKTSENRCAIISEKQKQRLESYLQQMDGLEVVQLDSGNNHSNKYPMHFIMPLYLTILADYKLHAEHGLLQDEIFGPILVILPYQEKEEIIQFINKKPRPLTATVFSNSIDFINYFKNNTHSGTFNVNDLLLHYGNLNLPFGGTGDSGIGTYHGEFSFNEFTYKRTYFEQSWMDYFIGFIYPPYSKLKTKILNWYLFKN